MAADIRCEWGRRGIEAHVAELDVVVIVDVLSFSICVVIQAVPGRRAWISGRPGA